MAYEGDFLAQLQHGIGAPFMNSPPNALLPPAPAPAAPVAPAAPTPSQEVLWVPHDNGGATNWGGPYYQPADANATGGPVPNGQDPVQARNMGVRPVNPQGSQTGTMVMPGTTNSLANFGTTQAQSSTAPAAPASSVAGSIYGYQGNDAAR